jgi:hypothetical protein
MMAFFSKQLRRIRLAADWLDDRQATRDIRRLREKYAPLVAEAEKQKNRNERDRLLAEQSLESTFILHPVYARKGERLTEKARRYGIIVPSEPGNYTDDSEDWYLSSVYGFWFPSPQLTQRLQRETRDAQRASYDEFRKWATLAFAIAGSLLAFISVRTRQKQPDPCPQYYYRDDFGECVFALSARPAKKGIPDQRTPTSTPPEKPTPARKSPAPLQ